MKNGSLYQFRFKGQIRRGIFLGTVCCGSTECYLFKMPPKGGTLAKHNPNVAEIWERKTPACKRVTHIVEIETMKSNNGRIVQNKNWIDVNSLPF